MSIVNCQKSIGDLSGQAMLEFVLLLPLFTLMFFGLIEIGLILCSEQAITYAVREGARAGALTNSNEQIVGAVRTAMRYLDPENKNTRVEITPEDEEDSLRARGNPLTVKIEYTVPLHIPLVSANQIILKSESTARIEK